MKRPQYFVVELVESVVNIPSVMCDASAFLVQIVVNNMWVVFVHMVDEHSALLKKLHQDILDTPTRRLQRQQPVVDRAVAVVVVVVADGVVVDGTDLTLHPSGIRRIVVWDILVKTRRRIVLLAAAVVVVVAVVAVVAVVEAVMMILTNKLIPVVVVGTAVTVVVDVVVVVVTMVPNIVADGAEVFHQQWMMKPHSVVIWNPYHRNDPWRSVREKSDRRTQHVDDG
jgi:hypothetical protein